MDNDMFIYVDDIPDFKKYDLVNVDEELHKTLFKLPPEKMPLGTSSLYIKGKDYIETKEKTFYHEYLLKDFLKLGKNLYKLAKQNNKIKFDSTNIISDKDFESYYLEEDFFKIKLTDNQNNLINKIFNEFEKIDEQLIDDKDGLLIIDPYLTTAHEIIDSLYFIYDRLNIEIDKYLTGLLDILKEINKNIKKIDDITCLASLLISIKLLADDINKIKIENKFNLKGDISLALKNPTKITIDKKFDNPPLSITFNYSQYPIIKKYILNWVKEYGLPYYLSSNTDDKYKEKINKLIKLTNDETAVPCEDLIISSIFSYIFYTIRNDWKKADDTIKTLFGFKEDNKINNNKKQITRIKELFSYYNTETITNLLGFRCSCESIDIIKNTNDNYFKYFDDITQSYKEKIFNNICLASYYLVENKTNLKKQKIHLSTKNKQKQCPICGKWFTPNQKYRTYCSNKCRNENNRIKDKLKKRKKRGYKGERNLNG